MTLAEVHEDLHALSDTGTGLLVVCNKMDRNPLFRTEWLVDPTLPDIHPYLLGEAGISARIPHSSSLIHHYSPFRQRTR